MGMLNHSGVFLRNANKRTALTPRSLISYFSILSLSLPHTWVGLVGFSLFLVMGWQVVTGFILSMGFIPEPMYVPASREVEDLEGFHIDDIFWLHERGVDYLFLLIYGHIFRKMFMSPISHETESSWKSGAIAYLLLQ